MNKILYAYIITHIVLTACALSTTAKDCNITIIVENEKERYLIGDTITILVKVELEDKICESSGDANKIFCKGLEILEHSSWEKISENVVGKRLSLAVVESKIQSTLTVYRKTGHYNCFRQRKFNVVIPDD